ncbi:MAG: hypothetical protein ACI4JB_09470 [Porcipelethomonas sp.]
MSKTKILSAVISSAAAMTCVCTAISRNVIPGSQPERNGQTISAVNTAGSSPAVKEKERYE